MKRALALLVLALCACGAGTKTATDSGIEGRVLVGPTCPVETNPPAPQCSPRPGSLDLVFKKGDAIVARAHTDAMGRFRVVLDPGRYRIEGAGAMPPTVEPQDVVVVARAFTTITVRADSGIR